MKHALSFFAVWFLLFAAGPAYGQEFSFKGFVVEGDYAGASHQIRLSFTDRTVQINDATGKEIATYRFDSYHTSSDDFALFDSNAHIGIGLHSLGLVVFKRGEESGIIHIYRTSESDYRFADILKVYVNDDTFHFTANKVEYSSWEEDDKAGEFPLAVSLNRMQILTIIGGIQDIKGIGVGTFPTPGGAREMAVVIDVPHVHAELVYSTYFLFQDRMVYEMKHRNGNVGHAVYSRLRGLDFDRLYRTVAERFGNYAPTPTQTPAQTPATPSAPRPTPAPTPAASDWRTRLHDIMRQGSNRLSNGSGALTGRRPADYMKGGPLTSRDDKAMILYQWADGTLYMGEYDNGNFNGKCLVIPARGATFNGLPGWGYFVGDYADGAPEVGTRYDLNGKLTHNVAFHRGEIYRQIEQHDVDGLTFGVIQYGPNDESGRDFYVGQIGHGRRHGYGLMVWKDNNVWLGSWINDARTGIGVEFSPDGRYSPGRWNGNTVQDLE